MGRLNYVKEKNRKLEDRTRRNNLRIDGVHENEGETWNETEEKVKNIFKEKLEIEGDIEIEKAHRMYGNNNIKNNNSSNRPKTIILKLLKYKDKEVILNRAKKLTGTNMYIYEDFSDETNQIRKQLKVKMKEERAKGNYCVIKYDRLFTRQFKNDRKGPSKS